MRFESIYSYLNKMNNDSGHRSVRVGTLGVAAPSCGRQAIGQTRERRELLPPLMVVAHCYSLGQVPRAWVRGMALCARVASGVHLSLCLLVQGGQPQSLLVDEGARRVQTLYLLVNESAFCCNPSSSWLPALAAVGRPGHSLLGGLLQLKVSSSAVSSSYVFPSSLAVSFSLRS